MNQEIAIRLAEKLADDLAQNRLTGSDQERVNQASDRITAIAAELNLRPYTVARVARALSTMWTDQGIQAERVLRHLEP